MLFRHISVPSEADQIHQEILNENVEVAMKKVQLAIGCPSKRKLDHPTCAESAEVDVSVFVLRRRALDFITRQRQRNKSNS